VYSGRFFFQRFKETFYLLLQGRSFGAAGSFETSVIVPQYTMSIPRESILHVNAFRDSRVFTWEQAFLLRHSCCGPGDQLARKCDSEEFT